MSNATLVECDLSNAYLPYAILTGADLTKADVTGADLYEANLDSTRLDEVRWDEGTVWPAARVHEIQANSEELPDGTYRIRERGEHMPSLILTS